ncbi:collagen binding domain-containing protein, partial [Lactiplantibacillus plantarum]
MYKKIYAYLSVLLLVGSIFSSPITSMADTNFYRDATTGKVNPEKSVSDKKEQTVRTAKIDQVDGGKTTSNSMLGDEKAFSTTAQARAPANFKETSKDWEDQFITKAELQDENGNPKTDFSIYDNMQAAWDFVIPANKAKSGDTMTVAIPSVLTLATVTKFDITDAGGTVIGHAVADPNTGKVTITLTDAVKNNHNAVTGSFKLWVHWNTSEVEQDTTVPVNWGNSGSTDIHIDPSNGPDPDEVLYKWGWYDTNNPNIIHWRVRINYANKTINNTVYTDLVGGNQTLVSGSVSAYKVKFQSDGESFNILSVYPDSATSENGTSGFKTTLGDISGPVIIDYETNITNNGASAHYENSGNLTGDNIEKQTVDVYSPDNGGGGNADTTITISGTKIWQDNNNQDGQRPNSITVNLLANGKQIQSQKVTAT